MALSRVVENALDAGCGVLGPFAVHGTTVFEDAIEDGQQAESHDGFLVEHVQLVGNGPSRDTGTGGQDGSLRDEAVTWEGVDDRLCLLLRLFGGDVGLVAVGCERESG